MGLKAAHILSPERVEKEIKSDQNGIERKEKSRRLRVRKNSDKIRPKWDWKTFCIICKKLFFELDKIRPKWDWKFKKFNELFGFVETIKSDQNGIESILQTRHANGSFSR